MGILARCWPKQRRFHFGRRGAQRPVGGRWATKDRGLAMHGLKIATSNRLGPRPKGPRRGIGKRSTASRQPREAPGDPRVSGLRVFMSCRGRLRGCLSSFVRRHQPAPSALHSKGSGRRRGVDIPGDHTSGPEPARQAVCGRGRACRHAGGWQGSHNGGCDESRPGGHATRSGG
jgi:hypothetical protein